VVGDKTLMQQSLTGKDLEEADALRLAELLDANTKAIARFVKIEDKLDDVLNFVEWAKKSVKWLAGLMVANYIGTFWSSFDSLL